MGADSKIQWTDHTFNPWWGCVRVSPGCENCYAERDAKRWGVRWGVGEERRFFGEAHWNDPVGWNTKAYKLGERRRVFCASMADVFEDRADLAPHRARLFRLIERTPHLDWLLLTKRPENADRLWAAALVDAYDGAEAIGPRWGANVWLGTTAEDQRRLEERLPHLLRAPAAVHFLSCEPLLSAIDLRRATFTSDRVPAKLDWVIVGGESGPRARPFDFAWARQILEQCRAAGVATFVKQAGAVALDSDYNGFSPLSLRDRKGGDPGEWPKDLRVREFPR